MKTRIVNVPKRLPPGTYTGRVIGVGPDGITFALDPPKRSAWKRVALWTVGLASGCVLLYLAAYAFTLVLLYLEVFHGSR